MMKMNVAVLIFFCESLVIFTFTGAQAQGFTLEVQRLENAITLTCTDSTTGNSPDPAPQFFRGATGVRVDNQNGFTRIGNMLTFRITRELEDEYTCGTTSAHSNAEAIIAQPTSESVEEPDPAFAVAGQPRQVELKCAISPGNLLERYFVTWYKADEIIYRTNEDGTVNTNSDLERFSHNSSNLALIINNVELDDASDNYHCVLHVVVNPLNRATESYNILRNLNIRLVVLAHPVITHPPEPQIVVENDRDVTFSCTATGYPSPKIIWFYRGNAVRPGNDGPRPESIIEDHSTTSTLTFPSVSGMDSGKIRCVARAPPDANTGGIRLNTSEVSTHLSVLGQFTDVAVRITVDSDVIFDVDLPVELEDPVRLYLQYIDVDSGKVDEVQTSAMYTNLRNIRHIEFDSDVIFERFQVTIAVESVDGTRGPLRPAGQYDKRVPNTPLRELIRQTPVIAVCSVFFVVIVCALILSIFVAKNCFDIQKKRLQSNDTKVCKSVTELEKLDESNHMQADDTDFVKGVVKSVAGDPPCRNTRRKNPSQKFPIVCKFLRLQSAPVSGTDQEQQADDRLSCSLDLRGQQPNNIVSDAGTQGNDVASPEDSLSKGSYAVTTFVAKKLYAGLKDPTHRQKFRAIVTRLMEATNDGDSETVPLISGSLSPQERNGAVHVALNMDGNTDSASDNSGHVEESKN